MASGTEGKSSSTWPQSCHICGDSQRTIFEVYAHTYVCARCKDESLGRGIPFFFKQWGNFAPAELARAMGFEEYEFTGSREEQVKQIGNAVSVRTARAL